MGNIIFAHGGARVKSEGLTTRHVVLLVDINARLRDRPNTLDDDWK